MSERYEKLFSLPQNFYAQGSPLLIEAGNLLKDTQTGRVLAQLKLKNVSDRTVKAATVAIRALDTMGRPLDGDTEKEYLDLQVAPGERFGQKLPVLMPNASTRGFEAAVSAVVFEDNSDWKGANCQWALLPGEESLVDKLGDAELVKQYQLRFGGECRGAPTEAMGLWRCACGAWNGGETCRGCGKDRDAQLSLKLDELRAERDARLEKEKAEREAKEAAALAWRKKMKIILAIAVPAFALLIAALVIVGNVTKSNRYEKAETLLAGGEYEEAAELFGQLGDYRESGMKLEEAERLARTGRAQARLAGKSYYYESPDPEMNLRTQINLRDDGGLEYRFEMTGYSVVFEDASYEVVGELEADKILISCHMGVVRSVRDGVETEEKDQQEYWVVELDDEDEILNFVGAQVYVCEEGQSVPAREEYYWQYKIFMTGEGKIWKVVEPG